MYLLGATFKIYNYTKFQINNIWEKIIDLISTVFVDYLLNNYTAGNGLTGQWYYYIAVSECTRIRF